MGVGIGKPVMHQLGLPGNIQRVKQDIPNSKLDTKILVVMSRIDAVVSLVLNRAHDEAIHQRTVGDREMRMLQMKSR